MVYLSTFYVNSKNYEMIRITGGGILSPRCAYHATLRSQLSQRVSLLRYFGGTLESQCVTFRGCPWPRKPDGAARCHGTVTRVRAVTFRL